MDTFRSPRHRAPHDPHRLTWSRALATSALLCAALATGCTAPQRSAPPAGTEFTKGDAILIGPHTTEPTVVRVDGFHGPEYHQVWYRYTALLADGSARVTESGALELVQGTLFVHARRESRTLSIEAATERAAWASAAPPSEDQTRPEDLLALQIISEPGTVTAQQRALWWYPIVVSDPTQQGTTGTDIVVQRSVDAAGAATSRVFLRPPTTHLFGEDSRVWLASAPDTAKPTASMKDLRVAWLLGTDVYAESMLGAQGVETRILPVDGATEQWLKDLEATARRAGVR